MTHTALFNMKAIIDIDVAFEELDINGSVALYNGYTETLVVYETKVADTTILPPYDGILKYVFTTRANGVPRVQCLALPDFQKDFNLLTSLYRYAHYNGTIPVPSSLPFAAMLSAYNNLRTKVQFHLPLATTAAWNAHHRIRVI